MIFKMVFCIASGLVIFLPPVLAAGWNKRRLTRRVENETCFYLHYSPLILVIFAVLAVFPYAASMAMLFMGDIRDHGEWFGVMFFLVFAFMVMLASICCMFSEVKVEPDVMTRYEYPLPVRRYRFHDITSVRYVEDLLRRGTIYGRGKSQLIFYRNGKKIFSVDSDYYNFELLVERMKAEKGLERGYSTGKGIEFSEWKDEFTVAGKAEDKRRAFSDLIFLGGMLALGIFVWKEEGEGFFWFFCFAFLLWAFLLGIKEYLKAAVWKATVTDQEIQVRNSIGRECSCSFQDITKIEEKDAAVILYADGKKFAKIDKSAENAALLVERLRRIVEQQKERAMAAASCRDAERYVWDEPGRKHKKMAADFGPGKPETVWEYGKCGSYSGAGPDGSGTSRHL